MYINVIVLNTQTCSTACSTGCENHSNYSRQWRRDVSSIDQTRKTTPRCIL